MAISSLAWIGIAGVLAARFTGRAGGFRRHQGKIRATAGVVVILLALALVYDVPSALQRAIPHHSFTLQHLVGGDGLGPDRLNLGGDPVSGPDAQLANCANGAVLLANCGPAPDIRGIDGWLNTPGGAPVSLQSLRGKVVLVDFWAYSCINCQRAVPHVVAWYQTYRDSGLAVIGVHTPEFAFERVRANVASGAAALGIPYPVALDNSYATWTNYRNHYWPAEYLIDATGTIRHIQLGEGGYSATESLIRQLLESAHPGTTLPAATVDFDAPPVADAAGPIGLAPDTYLGVDKVANYGGTGVYDVGSASFDEPPVLSPNTFALRGPWTLDDQCATADSDASSIELDYFARNVYLVVGGTGTVTVVQHGRTDALPISGPPTWHQIVAGDKVERDRIQVRLTRGLQAFAFIYG